MSTNKIISLVNKLLSILREKDNLRRSEGFENFYYSIATDDSNVSEFEALNNYSLIGVNTYLDEKYVKVVLTLLDCIFSNQYYIFMNLDDFNSNQELRKNLDEDRDFLLSYDDANLWLYYLTNYLSDLNLIKTKRIPEIWGAFYDDLENGKKYAKKYENFPQTFLKINEISTNMTIRKNGIDGYIERPRNEKNKKFLNGYVLFIYETKNKFRDQGRPEPLPRDIGEMWNNLTKEEKNEYHIRAKEM
jgi:hypothetical protein